MSWAVIGIIFGILLGVAFSVSIPVGYAHYTAVVIIAVLDALFGAIRSEVACDRFDPLIFITGFLFNTILAVFITYLGENLGLNLYLAATVVFTFRIFKNVGISRRALLEKWIKKKNQTKIKYHQKK